ncbi:MAG: hypothetical protein Q8900_02290 [Bacillota bacterium]|nr:hypothetical protein [Bacillota bacterium]
MTGLSDSEFIEKYNVDSHRDLDVFWDKIEDGVDDIDIRNIHIIGFHVLAVLLCTCAMWRCAYCYIKNKK